MLKRFPRTTSLIACLAMLVTMLWALVNAAHAQSGEIYVPLLINSARYDIRSAEIEIDLERCDDMPTIQRGDRTDNTTLAQDQLLKVGGIVAYHIQSTGGADGIFGAGTASAVLAAQRIAFPNDPDEHDSIIGPNTWQVLGCSPDDLPLIGILSDAEEVEDHDCDMPLVRFGSRSDAVATAQEQLKKMGGAIEHYIESTGGADGIFGEGTFAAVLLYQRLVFPAQPAEFDSIIGPKTWAKLGCDIDNDTPRGNLDLVPPTPDDEPLTVPEPESDDFVSVPAPRTPLFFHPDRTPGPWFSGSTTWQNIDGSDVPVIRESETREWFTIRPVGNPDLCLAPRYAASGADSGVLVLDFCDYEDEQLWRFVDGRIALKHRRTASEQCMAIYGNHLDTSLYFGYNVMLDDCSDDRTLQDWISERVSLPNDEHGMIFRVKGEHNGHYHYCASIAPGRYNYNPLLAARNSRTGKWMATSDLFSVKLDPVKYLRRMVVKKCDAPGYAPKFYVKRVDID